MSTFLENRKLWFQIENEWISNPKSDFQSIALSLFNDTYLSDITTYYDIHTRLKSVPRDFNEYFYVCMKMFTNFLKRKEYPISVLNFLSEDLGIVLRDNYNFGYVIANTIKNKQSIEDSIISLFQKEYSRNKDTKEYFIDTFIKL